MQCCPMDTYGTDSAGNLRPVCTCGDGCGCMCMDCQCGEDDDDDEVTFHYMPWGEIK